MWKTSYFHGLLRLFSQPGSYAPSNASKVRITHLAADVFAFVYGRPKACAPLGLQVPSSVEKNTKGLIRLGTKSAN